MRALVGLEDEAMGTLDGVIDGAAEVGLEEDKVVGKKPDRNHRR